jgi:hypothetical protein
VITRTTIDIRAPLPTNESTPPSSSDPTATMANIYEWMENVGPPCYAPTSPPYMAPPAPSFMPSGMDPYTDDPMDQTNIDPSLTTMLDPTAPSTSVVTVPSHLVEASGKVLIYLTQVLKISESIKDENEEHANMESTAEELEELEPIPEEDPEPPIPYIIDGVQVDGSPRPTDVKEIIDLRRVGTNRKTFYLARSVEDIYYWFPARRTYRDPQLHRTIRKYFRKTRAEANRMKKRNTKKIEEWKGC